MRSLHNRRILRRRLLDHRLTERNLPVAGEDCLVAMAHGKDRSAVHHEFSDSIRRADPGVKKTRRMTGRRCSLPMTGFRRNSEIINVLAPSGRAGLAGGLLT